MRKYQQAKTAAYLASCSPDAAYTWLKDSAPADRREQRAIFMRPNNKLLEYILLRRSHPLIDLGLASFGCSQSVVKRVYKRGGSAIRCAAWSNPNNSGGVWGPAGIWCDQATLAELVTQAPVKQLEAFAHNPGLSDDVLCDLVSRSKIFAELSEHRYITALIALGDNLRLHEAYENRHLDGYADYSYHRVFGAAWELTLTAPTTQLWASVLYELLRRCQRSPGFDKKAGEAIERWRIDTPAKDGERHFWPGNSFYLRHIIAGQMPIDENLKTSTDPALRRSFYARFDPARFKDWQSWLEVDGESFVDAAISNEKLWQTEELRHALSRLCWAVPDPSSNMDAPNMFNGMEERMERQHPEWFAKQDVPHVEMSPNPKGKRGWFK
jgi:hypothetical protein